MTHTEVSSGFPCTICGECCRHINAVPQLSKFNRGDGVCIHLQGNKCDIYKNRPEICNVDLMFRKYFSKQYSREEFYKLNLEACKKLQKGF